MKKPTIILAALYLLLCAYVNPPSPPLEKGGQGGFEPSRIISLKPNITEILFALGVGDKVVGVTTWCDYPLEAKKLPKVADYINLNLEKIIALKPGLVVGSEENSVKQQFAVLDSAGIKTLALPFRTMEELYGSIERIAKAVERAEDGRLLISRIKGELTLRAMPSLSRQSRETHVAGSRLRSNNKAILILVGHRPLVAAGPSTFYGELIKLIGAKNIVESSATPYPTINTEFILAKRPDVIIDMGMGSEANTELPDALKKKIVKFNLSDFRAGPRIGEAVRKLHALLSSPL